MAAGAEVPCYQASHTHWAQGTAVCTVGRRRVVETVRSDMERRERRQGGMVLVVLEVRAWAFAEAARNTRVRVLESEAEACTWVQSGHRQQPLRWGPWDQLEVVARAWHRLQRACSSSSDR